VQETWRPLLQTHRSQPPVSIGGRDSIWTGCAATHGVGKRPIHAG
jgi:hypothetical protein